MRASLTGVAYNGTAGTKDSTCSTDFGASYGAATQLETGSYSPGYLVTDTFAAEVFPFNLRDVSTTMMVGPTYIRNANTNATKPVICVKIN